MAFLQRLDDSQKKIIMRCAFDDKVKDTIMLTCPYNVDPLTPHFYKPKVGVLQVYTLFLL